jgi:ubiquitin thioesterase protein OTUB1
MMAEHEAEWMQVAKQGPLVSDPMSALCLKAEYAGNANENFLLGIESLAKRYDAMRRVRGDGNCFFRAFIFALCEQLLSPDGNPGSASSSQTARLRACIEETIRASKAELIAVGYSEIAIDAFWETFVDYLAAMETRSHAELYPLFTFRLTV